MQEKSAINSIKNQKVIKMTINIPQDLHKKFKGLAAIEGANMTDILIKHIEQYVAEREKKEK